jgi:hypothetical protein
MSIEVLIDDLRATLKEIGDSLAALGDDEGYRALNLSVRPRPFRHAVLETARTIEHHPMVIVRHQRFCSGQAHMLTTLRAADSRNVVAVFAEELTDIPISRVDGIELDCIKNPQR